MSSLLLCPPPPPLFFGVGGWAGGLGWLARSVRQRLGPWFICSFSNACCCFKNSILFSVLILARFLVEYFVGVPGNLFQPYLHS